MTFEPFLVVAFFVGYFFGSIPFGLLLTKLAGTEDLRSIGSGSIGATNVLRTGRKGLAAATLILDALKGTVAVLAAYWFGGQDLAILAALGAFLGHLPNDGCGQEFLIRAQRQHLMLSDGVQQPATLGHRLPPASQHIEMSAGPKQMAAESRLEIAGRPGPISGQPIDEQILEQHVAYLDRGSARLYEDRLTTSKNNLTRCARHCRLESV